MRTEDPVRELHVVALSEDGRSVLLATSKNATSGGFRLKLDDKLVAAMRGDLPRPGESASRGATVTPKEIQARMRAGESAEEIATSAGMPLARVERFAGPVLSERERIIEEARAAFLSRGRLGPSLLPLGDAVDAALAETPSLRGDSVSWSARRLDSGHWLVQVSYVSRARLRTGSWVFDPHTRSLVPSDPASAALGHTGESAPTRKTAPVARAATPVARKRPAARKKPAARKAAAKAPAKAAKAAPTRSAPAKPKPAAKAPARKAAVAKAAPKRAVAKKAPVRTASPAAAERAAAKRAAALAAQAPPPVETPPPPVETPPVETPVEAVVIEAVEPAAPEGPPTLRVVPAPPAELTPTPTKKRAAGERATVPDWADVLFGAAPRDRKDG